MAQINLLKQKTDNSQQLAVVSKVIARLLVVALVVLVGYYVWLIVRTNQTNSKILAITEQINKDKAEALVNKDRIEVLARQQQLQALDTLITNHLYWSGLLPALAKVTLKTAEFANVTAHADGTITMNVTLPSLEDLDKFLQVFDDEETVKNFSNVRIGGYHLSPQGEAVKDQPPVNVVKVDVRMQFNNSLLGYKSK